MINCKNCIENTYFLLCVVRIKHILVKQELLSTTLIFYLLQECCNVA